MTFKIEKNEDKIIYNYEFNGLNELASYIEKTPINKKCFTSLASTDKNYKFFQTNNFDEALNLCKFGISPGSIKEFLNISNDLEAKLPDLTKDRTIIENVYGIRPNVQKFLRGNPKSMYSLKRFTPKGIIDVYYNVSIKAITKQSIILKRGICSIQLVKLLEKLGYIVSFNLISLSQVDNEYTYVNVKIKNDNEKIDAVTSYFPMCHPSFPRRIIFRLKEVTPYLHIYQNYGYVVDLEEFIKDDKNSKKIIIPSADTFANSSGDIENYFMDLCKNVNLEKFLNEQEQLDFDAKEKKLVIRRY